jgi:hypothetical protein
MLLRIYLNRWVHVDHGGLSYMESNAWKSTEGATGAHGQRYTEREVDGRSTRDSQIFEALTAEANHEQTFGYFFGYNALHFALQGVSFEGKVFAREYHGYNPRFSMCSMQGVSFKNATFHGQVRFDYCNLAGADFTGVTCTTQFPKFNGCYLAGAIGIKSEWLAANGLPIEATQDRSTEHVCADCDAPRNTLFKLYNGRPHCPSCFDTHVGHCTCCSQDCDTDNLVSVELPASTFNGQFLCRACYNERFSSCYSCHTTVERLDCSVDEESGRYMCERCTQTVKRRTLHSYGFKPKAKFFTGKSEHATPATLYFGTELEVEGPDEDGVDHDEDGENYDEPQDSDMLNRYSAKVTGEDGWCYCKTDGSLDHGFEIVSHPFSWEWFKENGEKLIKPKYDLLQDAGFTSYITTTCGLHVHLARSAFGVLSLKNTPRGTKLEYDGRASTGSPHLYRFCRFFYHNPDFIRFVARRRKDRIKEYASPYSAPRNLPTIAKGEARNDERYTAVNCQNEKTVEVRVFRGTLGFAGYTRALEFCHSLHGFTRIAGNGQLHYSNFVEYVGRERKTYPHLFKFLKERMPQDEKKMKTVRVENREE